MLTDESGLGNQPDDDLNLQQGKCLSTRLDERQLIRAKLLQTDKTSSNLPNSPSSQKDQLIDALSRGLTFADSQRILSVGVMCPTSLPSLTSELSSQSIRQLFIEAIVIAIQRSSLHLIKRVMCVEMNSSITDESPLMCTTSALTALQPAAGDSMTLTLIQHLERSHTPFPSLSMAATATSSTDRFTLVTCNVGLPMNLQAESLVESSPKQPAHMRILPVASRGPVVVRGLPHAVLYAIESIKRVTSVWGGNGGTTMTDKDGDVFKKG
jgi:hypothetical protein